MSHLDTKMRLLAVASLLFGGVAFADGASHSKTSDMRGPVSSGTGTAAMAKNVDLTFKKGQSQLTAAQRNKIRTFINGAKNQGEIEEVKIAVWSDKPFPTSGAELPETERTLASARGEQLETFLADQLDLIDVEVFNMAEQSNWLARTFNTDQAELKSVFSMEGGAPMSNEDFQVFKTKGQASKAVILIRHAGDVGMSPADPASLPPQHGQTEDLSY